MSLGKRLLHGAGVGLMEHVVKTAVLFITTPLMVHWLTIDSYGFWLAAMSALGYFSLLDLGMSFATTRFMAVAVGAKDRRQQSVIYQMASGFYAMVSSCIAAGSTVMFVIMAWYFARQDHHSLATMAAATIPVGLSLALRFRWRMPQLLLRAWTRYDLLSWASIIRVLAQSACLIVLLPRGGGLVLVGVLQALGDVLELWLLSRFATRLPHLHHDAIVEDDSARALRKEMLSFTSDMVLSRVGDYLRGNMGSQVTLSLAGLDKVPLYSMGTRLISMLEDVINALFGGSILSIFGQLKGGGDPQRLNREFRRIMSITAGFGVAAMGGLVIFGKVFILRWLGPKFDPAYEIMVILAPSYALFFMQYPSNSILYAVGWQRPLTIMRCAGGLLAGAASIGFGLAWGFKGIAWGPAVEMGLVYAIAFPWLVHRATGIPLPTYVWSYVVWPGIKGLALPGLAAYAMKDWIIADYTHIFVCAAIYAILMGVSAPLLLLDREGRQMLFAALGRR